jgi:hypothetical protein
LVPPQGNIIAIIDHYSLRKLPQSVPKGPLGLVQGKVFPASLWAENCPNFSFFCLGRVILIMTRFLNLPTLGYFNYDKP